MATSTVNLMGQDIYNPELTKIRSPNFSIFMHAWNGNWSSLPLMTMFGKSSKWTSRGSGIRKFG